MSEPQRTPDEERVDGRLDEAARAQLDRSDEYTDDEAPEPGTFGLRVPVATGEMALRATDLGIRYNLNLTKKAKLQTSFAHLLDPRHRQKGHFWALRDDQLDGQSR